MLCVCEQVLFTEKCEEAVRSHSMQELKVEMEKQLESYTSVDMTDDSSANVLELKLKSLILDTIHNIDVIDQLNDHGVKALNEWMWQKQLR